MVSINTEINDFYNNLNDDVNNLSSKTTNLTETLDLFKNYNSKFSESVSCYYKGKALDNTMQNLSLINEMLSLISSSINEKLNPAITQSQSIITSTKELINLKNSINSAESATTEDDGTTTNEEYSFNSKQKEILDKIRGLKDLDGVIDMESITGSSGGIDPANLIPGTYKEYTFTASNGVTVTYCAYIPEGIEDIEGLPIHMHLWPSRPKGPLGYYNVHGLPRILYNGGSASGVVICPKLQANEVYDNAYLDALKELSDNYVKTYNCDANRVSMSGHGGGGQAAINFAAKYPDYLSKVMSLYTLDSAKNYDELGLSKEAYEYNLSKNDITLIRCTGGGDTLDESSIRYTNELYNSLNAFTDVDIYNNPHYIYGDDLFSEPFTYDGKTYANMLEYLFAQERDNPGNGDATPTTNKA